MQRVNFLYVEIKVYPASIEEGQHTGYDWNTLLVASKPVLSTYENLFDLRACTEGRLQDCLIRWVREETLNKGKEFIYQNCPKAPKE